MIQYKNQETDNWYITVNLTMGSFILFTGKLHYTTVNFLRNTLDFERPTTNQMTNLDFHLNCKLPIYEQYFYTQNQTHTSYNICTTQKLQLNTQKPVWK